MGPVSKVEAAAAIPLLEAAAASPLLAAPGSSGVSSSLSDLSVLAILSVVSTFSVRARNRRPVVDDPSECARFSSRPVSDICIPGDAERACGDLDRRVEGVDGIERISVDATERISSVTEDLPRDDRDLADNGGVSGVRGNITLSLRVAIGGDGAGGGGGGGRVIVVVIGVCGGPGGGRGLSESCGLGSGLRFNLGPPRLGTCGHCLHIALVLSSSTNKN